MLKAFQIVKDFWSILKSTGKSFMAEDPFGKSAAVAYYAIFSMPALLVIVITIAGVVFGQEAVSGTLSTEISDAIGTDAAKTVEGMLASSRIKDNTFLSTVVGVGVLLFGATGLFIQLQKALNDIWEVQPKAEAGIGKVLKDRATSLGMVVVIGFLLLISLLLSAAISFFSGWIAQHFGDWMLYFSGIFDFLISLAIIAVLFAAIFKVLPDIEVRWKSVWIGGILTALLFTLGKFLIGLYLGKADPGSAFGAAGSVILILLWVSYSCILILFGAKFTQQYAVKFGHGVHPSKHAEYTPAYKLRHMDLSKEEMKSEISKSSKSKKI